MRFSDSLIHGFHCPTHSIIQVLFFPLAPRGRVRACGGCVSVCVLSCARRESHDNDSQTNNTRANNDDDEGGAPTRTKTTTTHCSSSPKSSSVDPQLEESNHNQHLGEGPSTEQVGSPSETTCMQMQMRIKFKPTERWVLALAKTSMGTFNARMRCSSSRKAECSKQVASVPCDSLTE